MKNRRDFMKTSLAVTAGIFSTNISPAFASKHSFTKGVVYTKECPGKWAKKVGSHLPIVTVEGNKITIETKHSMSQKHYIVRHTLVSGSGEVLGEKTFYPSDEKALSVFEISDEYSVLYATSFCNKHDFWVAEIMV